MRIQDLFQRNISRAINGVIKADQSDEASVWQELDEYVITRELDGHLRRFFDTYLAALDNPTQASGNVGVWVSGFFGSGKSHFIKILSYLLENRTVTHDGQSRTALEFFEEKVSDAMLAADFKRAITGKTDVLLFNIDSKASDHSRDAILQVFLKVFNEMRGYSPDHPHIAWLEQELDEKGVYAAFKDKFEETAGSSWLKERDGYTFYSDAVATSYSAAMGQKIEDADAWLDRADRDFKAWLSIENFAHLIRSYIDSQGDKHRIVFLVDEIGQFIGANSQLMLNLQTITENLGTVCDGRAWVIVTAQEDIDTVVGQISRGDAQDFSKIQGRFRTRQSLSSANVDEVIQKRLLEKTPDAEKELRAIYGKQADILKNQLSFSNTGRTYKAFTDEDNFAAVYPFAPYQFQLVQSIFESIRKAGATGLHLARGERSLLDAFQSAAVAIGNDNTGALVPLHRFYPSIESFLEGVVKSTIDNAATNTSLEDFDVLVLKTLFLIRYVDELKGSVDNLITLFIDEIDADRRALRLKIEDSLQRLEGQTLVSRNGDDFFFLTNEERDISREIKNVDLTSADEAKELGKLLFDEALRLNRKFRFNDNNNDFELNLSCDMHPHGARTEGDLNLLVITPLVDERPLWNEAKSIMESSRNDGQVIVRLADDADLATELRQYLQTDKYILRHNDGSLPHTTQNIIRARADENRQRRERLRNTMDRLVREADIFVSGQTPELKASTAATAINEALHYLVRNSFNKLGYIDHLTPDPQKEIAALLSDPSNYSLDLGNEETTNTKAIKEVRQYVEISTAQSRRLVLHDMVHDHFSRRPYGWPEWESIFLIIKLVKAGELSLIQNNTLTTDQIWACISTPARWRSIQVEQRKAVGSAQLQQTRQLAKDVFQEIAPDGEDKLYAFLQKHLTEWQANFRQWHALANSGQYPGKEAAYEGDQLISRLSGAADSFTAIDAFQKSKNELLDVADNYSELRNFFTNQKPTWDKLQRSLQHFQLNRVELEKNDRAGIALARLVEIQTAASPFALLPEVENLVATVTKVNNEAVEKAHAHVSSYIDTQIAKVQADLLASEADAHTSNQLLLPLQNLKKNAAQQSSLAHLYQLSPRALALADVAITQLAKLAEQQEKEREKNKDASGNATKVSDQPAAKPIKPIEVVKPYQATQGYLQSQQDVDAFLAKLRESLEAAIKAGKRIEIR